MRDQGAYGGMWNAFKVCKAIDYKVDVPAVERRPLPLWCRHIVSSMLRAAKG